MNDVETMKGLKIHLKELTVNIGNRSIRFPENIEKTAEYIEAFYKNIGILPNIIYVCFIVLGNLIQEAG